MSGYIDLNPDAVSASGRRTAATAQDWARWARRSEAALRDLAVGARHPAVQGAVEELSSECAPMMRGLVVSAQAQGGNAAAAAQTMVGADQQSAGVLDRAGAEASRLGSVLSRPINNG